MSQELKIKNTYMRKRFKTIVTQQKELALFFSIMVLEDLTKILSQLYPNYFAIYEQQRLAVVI